MTPNHEGQIRRALKLYLERGELTAESTLTDARGCLWRAGYEWSNALADVARKVLGIQRCIHSWHVSAPGEAAAGLHGVTAFVELPMHEDATRSEIDFVRSRLQACFAAIWGEADKRVSVVTDEELRQRDEADPPGDTCGTPCLDIGGTVFHCELPVHTVGQHAKTLVEDGKKHVYRWGPSQ